MQENEFIEDDALVVKESKVAHLIIGVVFFAMIMSAVFIGGFFSMPVKVIISIIGTVILSIWSIFLNQETLRIDCNGIYQHKELVTNWDNFVQAYIEQAKVSGSYQDNFQLILEYSKNGIVGFFKRTVPLTNTQNKSEEEVLEAIQRFHRLSHEKIIPTKQPLAIGDGVEEDFSS